MCKREFRAVFVLTAAAAFSLAGIGAAPRPQGMEGTRYNFAPADFAGTRTTGTYSRGNGPSISPGRSPLSKVELVVIDGGNPGPVRVGFHVALEPGWRLYWANPGDAGLAPSVRWTLPEGFAAGPLRHPVPEKAVEEGIVSYEHRGEVLLLCEITPTPGYRPGERWEAAAAFEWMACREGCVTGETAVRAVFPARPESLAGGKALLEKFASRFPRPLVEAGLTAGPGRAEWTGKAWRVEIPLDGERASEAGDFFASPLEDFVIDNAAVSCRDGKIVLSLFPSAGPGSPAPPAVEGIVVIDGRGYEVSAPVVARQAGRDRIVPRPVAKTSADLTSSVRGGGPAIASFKKPFLPVYRFEREKHDSFFPSIVDSAAASAASGTHIIRIMEVRS